MRLSDSALALVLYVRWRRSSVYGRVVPCLHVQTSLVLLLLEEHLLLDLLLVHLLSGCEVEVVDDVSDISHPIVVLSITDLSNCILA